MSPGPGRLRPWISFRISSGMCRLDDRERTSGRRLCGAGGRGSGSRGPISEDVADETFGFQQAWACY